MEIVDPAGGFMDAPGLPSNSRLPAEHLDELRDHLQLSPVLALQNYRLELRVDGLPPSRLATTISGAPPSSMRVTAVCRRLDLIRFRGRVSYVVLRSFSSSNTAQ